MGVNRVVVVQEKIMLSINTSLQQLCCINPLLLALRSLNELSTMQLGAVNNRLPV